MLTVLHDDVLYYSVVAWGLMLASLAGSWWLGTFRLFGVSIIGGQIDQQKCLFARLRMSFAVEHLDSWLSTGSPAFLLTINPSPARIQEKCWGKIARVVIFLAGEGWHRFVKPWLNIVLTSNDGWKITTGSYHQLGSTHIQQIERISDLLLQVSNGWTTGYYRSTGSW